MNILDADLRERLRMPALVWVALMVLLSGISAIGIFAPRLWYVEILCLIAMVAIVLIFSMEMMRHKPIVRLFSVIGFFWVAILFGMTMLDYLTR